MPKHNYEESGTETLTPGIPEELKKNTAFPFQGSRMPLASSMSAAALDMS